MLRAFGGGFLATVLILVAGEDERLDLTGCHSSNEECDEYDMLTRDELQGLDLLQTEMRFLPLGRGTLDARAAVPAPDNDAAQGSTHDIVVNAKVAAPSAASKVYQAAPKSWDFRTARLMQVDEQIRAASNGHASAVDELGLNMLLAQASALHISFHKASQQVDSYVKTHLSFQRTQNFGHTVFVIVSIVVTLTVVAYLAAPLLTTARPISGVGNGIAEEWKGEALPHPSTGREMPSQSGAAERLLGALPSPLSDGPPSICPSLILPHTEARFMVPIAHIDRVKGELDIRGTSGRKLLDGRITEFPDGRRSLALSSCGCEDDPRVTVVSLSDDTRIGCGSIEIYGKAGAFYGMMTPTSNGGAEVKIGSDIVMSLEAGYNDLRMTASSADGQLLASAGKNVQIAVRRMESQDTWKLQVKPGVDALLVTACMLGVLIFSQ